MTELAVLQGLRMRGQTTAAVLSEVTDLTQAEVERVLAVAVKSGLAAERGPMFRLTAAGHQHVGSLLAEERMQIDRAALGALYSDFMAINGDLKNTISAWQVRDGVPNTHSDAGYDDTITARLIALADEATPTLEAIATVASRLTRYATRLSLARVRIMAHEYNFIASPFVDSYHQVWFELHEELMNCLNLSRPAEDGDNGSEGSAL